MESDPNKYYRILCDLISKVNSTTDPETIPELVVCHVAEAMELKACSMRQYNFNKTELIPISSCGLSESYLKKGPIAADKCMAGTLRGEIVYLADATTDERMQYQDKAAKEGIVSILSVPITVEGIIYGALRVYTDAPHEFSEEDKQFLTTVADLIGITHK